MAKAGNAVSGQALAFGPFRLFPTQRVLLDAEKPLRLGGRALDILIALVERPGEVVSKEDLIARVWPNTFVEEGNLRVHLVALRKALGDGQFPHRYIANITGRGYSFVARVVRLSHSSELVSMGEPTTSHLPATSTRMVGRQDAVEAVAKQLLRSHFVTLVGAGGIGKTTVALAVAEAQISAYEDGVRFVDFSSLTDPFLVPSTLASALGVSVGSEDPLPGLITFLRDRRVLLVLDSCERVVEAASALAEAIFRGAPGAHILATSQEPLRSEGERVQRLPPLGFPPSAATLTASEALTFPAVQLFVERAAAALDSFQLTDANAGIVADICRRIDGIPLAIELAAGRIEAFGVAGLARLLDDRFRLLTLSHRTAVSRHLTLNATLDWSYQLLSDTERLLLRRLAIFVGHFTLEAANAVLSGTGEEMPDLMHCIANLVAKSLLTADVSSASVSYRLLDTTRAYAMDKLRQSGEFDQLALLHAHYYRDLFERAEIDWQVRTTDEWLTAYANELDNVRLALDWAFSPGGDTRIGVSLAIFAVPLWIHMSLMDECRKRMQQAIAFDTSSDGGNDPMKMKLYAGLGAALLYSKGPGLENDVAWSTVLEIAEDLGDMDYQLRAHFGLWVGRLHSRKFEDAFAAAKRFREVAEASGDPDDTLVGERIIGVTLFGLGDQINAQRHTEFMLGRYIRPHTGVHLVRFQFDQHVTACAMHGKILWLLGFPDKAKLVIERNIDDALACGHQASLFYALAVTACPVALFLGDLVAAENYTAMLMSRASQYGLEFWHTHGRCFEGILNIRHGKIQAGLRLLETTIKALPRTNFMTRYAAFLSELAEALVRAGELAHGLAMIDRALQMSEQSGERWCVPEMLRMKGEILLQDRALAPSDPEDIFLRSLDLARNQGALSWELRSAMSLARFRRDQGNRLSALELLRSTYGRFTEGFSSTDLKAAKILLFELAQP